MRWVLSRKTDETHRSVQKHTAVATKPTAHHPSLTLRWVRSLLRGASSLSSTLRWVSSLLRCTFPHCGGFRRFFATQPTAQHTSALLRWVPSLLRCVPSPLRWVPSPPPRHTAHMYGHSTHLYSELLTSSAANRHLAVCSGAKTSSYLATKHPVAHPSP